MGSITIIHQEYKKTIHELFNDTVEYDVPYLAHFIYYVVNKGLVKFWDSEEKLEEVSLTPVELQEFEQMYKLDFLKLRPVSLYAIRQKDCFKFYFGKNSQEVAELHCRTYGGKVSKMYHCYNQMIDYSIYFPDTNITRTFRGLLHELYKFPCYVCEMEGWNK